MSVTRKMRRTLGNAFGGLKKTSSISDANHEKILSEDSSFFIKEAYKSLRSNIIFSLSEEGCKKIVITSAGAGEGKSTNCLNIAITFAETGVRVCLIDCDLRKPNIARLAGKSISPGFSNVLVRLNSLDEVINKDVYKNLDIIFSGDIPPNPTELISSDKMKETLDELSQKYDYIFIDTPPVNLVTDASLIAKEASGVLFVVRQNETEKDDYIEAVEQLKFAGAKIIGTVFNGANITNKTGYKLGRRRAYYNSQGD